MNTARLLLLPILVLTATALTGGCSLKTEDVRIKLCRQVTERLLDSMKPLEWKSLDTEIRKTGDAAVRLGFGITREGYAGKTVTSACYFEHNLPEESALDHVNPLSAYATLPYAMDIQGKAVPAQILKHAVTNEQLEPLRQFLQGLEQEFESVTGAVQQK